MNSGKTIFSQLMEFLPVHEFRTCVARYNCNYKANSFTCWDQLLCMAFAQLTYRESLRDIQACLRGTRHKLYHMGIRGNVSRNTLANANKIRDGASTPTSPRCSSGRPEDCTPTKASAWNWIRQSTPWIPLQLICVSHCFREQYSAKGGEWSRCILSWICGAVFPQ